MKKFLLILCSFLTAASVLFAGSTGKLAGKITDKSTGEPIPFVNVILVGTTIGAATDVDGYYTILNIPPGTYSVRASAIGYNNMTVENVNIQIDFTTKIDLRLKNKDL